MTTYIVSHYAASQWRRPKGTAAHCCAYACAEKKKKGKPLNSYLLSCYNLSMLCYNAIELCKVIITHSQHINNKSYNSKSIVNTTLLTDERQGFYFEK